VSEPRVALVTGAGQGIGREHALALASDGVAVAVNDLSSIGAYAVVDEIKSAGGIATSTPGNVADSNEAEAMVRTAVETFGSLDILVNNAGVLRDRTIARMADDEFDDVVRVHLRGHFCMSRAAAGYWRERSAHNSQPRASIINTTSGSGLFGNPGQANYAAAKAGIAGLTMVAARELSRYGVRVNAISPQARTAMTLGAAQFAELVSTPDDSRFDHWHPANIAPVVVWLARPECAATGQVYEVHGSIVRRYEPWPITHEVRAEGRWTADALMAATQAWPDEPVDLTQKSSI